MNRSSFLVAVAFSLGLAVGLMVHLARSNSLEKQNSILRQLNEEQKQMLLEINEIIGKPRSTADEDAT